MREMEPPHLQVPPTLLSQLEEILTLEPKYQSNLQLPLNSQDGSDVTVGMRDGSAHVLRCLKVWYDLPSDVLFAAVNLMDRFLTKMKVRPKHMACIAVAVFQLGARWILGSKGIPESCDILAISQCPCTPGDLGRMQTVIASKLAYSQPSTSPITPLAFLRLFHELLSSVDLHQVYARAVNEGDLWQRLEVMVCDGRISNFRASEVALVLVCCQLDIGVASLKLPPSQSHLLSLLSYLAHLQHLCQISERNFYACHGVVLTILGRYDAELQTPHRQRLVWRVSQRTLRRLRPTERLVTTLPTIDEHGQLHIPPRKVTCDEGWAGMTWHNSH